MTCTRIVWVHRISAVLIKLSSTVVFHDQRHKCLQDIFSTLGAVSEVRIVKDRATGNSAGSAFVKFEDHQAAAIALKTINGRILYNKVRGLSSAILMGPSGLFCQMHFIAALIVVTRFHAGPFAHLSVHHCPSWFWRICVKGKKI